MSQIQVQEDYDEHYFDKLSEEEKKQIIENDNYFIKELKEGIPNENTLAGKLSRKPQSNIFREWTESLERLHYLGIYKEPIHTISDFMKKEISRFKFSEQEVEDFDIKFNFNKRIDQSIDQRFKDPFYSHKDGNDPFPTNPSALSDTHKFLLEGLEMFRFYHKRFADIAEDFIKKLEPDKLTGETFVYQDFEKVIEWDEIALFSHYLNELASENGLLDQIEDEQNVKEAATVLQKAMFKFLYADGGYRQMAYKFGVSTRRNQTIRSRLDHWPKKDAKETIMKVQGSYLCPCGCGYNFITCKKYHDITNDRYFQKFRWAEKVYKIPENLKNKRLGPLDIARKLWGKQVKLVLEKIQSQ